MHGNTGAFMLIEDRIKSMAVPLKYILRVLSAGMLQVVNQDDK